MNKRITISAAVVVLISLIPLIPWIFNGPVKDLPMNYENITHNLGQATALVGMTLFALTFVLATRLRLIEKMVGGLDKVYAVHRIIGSIAFMLILVHPIMLVLKYVPSDLSNAAGYLLPGHGLSVDLGIIALAGMIILLVATFYVNMKYNYWKLSHKFLGLFFILAVFHIFLVRGTASRDYIFEGYYAYAAIVSAIGIPSFFYSLMFKSLNPSQYKITSVRQNDAIYDISMSTEGRPLKYKAGQFAFFRFHNRKLGREYHPFSIAKSAGSKDLRIVIKNLGDYTSRLESLKEGDSVAVDGPYGGFTMDSNATDMLWIAAGVGITPFIAMAGDVPANVRKVRLYYCARTKSDFIALDEFKKIEETDSRFSIIPWCSSDSGRISAKDLGPINRDTHVYICGPVGFKQSLIDQLPVPAKNIHEEDFGLK